MKFGKSIRKEAGSNLRVYYIDYKCLKKIIKKASRTLENRQYSHCISLLQRFYCSLEAELVRVRSVHQAELQELCDFKKKTETRFPAISKPPRFSLITSNNVFAIHSQQNDGAFVSLSEESRKELRNRHSLEDVILYFRGKFKDENNDCTELISDSSDTRRTIKKCSENGFSDEKASSDIFSNITYFERFWSPCACVEAVESLADSPRKVDVIREISAIPEHLEIVDEKNAFAICEALHQATIKCLELRRMVIWNTVAIVKILKKKKKLLCSCSPSEELAWANDFAEIRNICRERLFSFNRNTTLGNSQRTYQQPCLRQQVQHPCIGCCMLQVARSYASVATPMVVNRSLEGDICANNSLEKEKREDASIISNSETLHKREDHLEFPDRINFFKNRKSDAESAIDEQKKAPINVSNASNDESFVVDVQDKNTSIIEACFSSAASLLRHESWYSSMDLPEILSVLETVTDEILQCLTGHPPSQEKYQCPICLDLIVDPVTLRGCCHRFCYNCLAATELTMQGEQLMRCPSCRMSVVNVYSDFNTENLNGINESTGTYVKEGMRNGSNLPMNCEPSVFPAFSVDNTLSSFLKNYFPEDFFVRQAETASFRNALSLVRDERSKTSTKKTLSADILEANSSIQNLISAANSSEFLPNASLQDVDEREGCSMITNICVSYPTNSACYGTKSVENENGVDDVGIFTEILSNKCSLSSSKCDIKSRNAFTYPQMETNEISKMLLDSNSLTSHAAIPSSNIAEKEDAVNNYGSAASCPCFCHYEINSTRHCNSENFCFCPSSCDVQGAYGHLRSFWTVPNIQYNSCSQAFETSKVDYSTDHDILVSRNGIPIQPTKDFESILLKNFNDSNDNRDFQKDVTPNISAATWEKHVNSVTGSVSGVDEEDTHISITTKVCTKEIEPHNLIKNISLDHLKPENDANNASISRIDQEMFHEDHAKLSISDLKLQSGGIFRHDDLSNYFSINKGECVQNEHGDSDFFSEKIAALISHKSDSIHLPCSSEPPASDDIFLQLATLLHNILQNNVEEACKNGNDKKQNCCDPEINRDSNEAVADIFGSPPGLSLFLKEDKTRSCLPSRNSNTISFTSGLAGCANQGKRVECTTPLNQKLDCFENFNSFETFDCQESNFSSSLSHHISRENSFNFERDNRLLGEVEFRDNESEREKLGGKPCRESSIAGIAQEQMKERSTSDRSINTQINEKRDIPSESLSSFHRTRPCERKKANSQLKYECQTLSPYGKYLKSRVEKGEYERTFSSETRSKNSQSKSLPVDVSPLIPSSEIRIDEYSSLHDVMGMHHDIDSFQIPVSMFQRGLLATPEKGPDPLSLFALVRKQQAALIATNRINKKKIEQLK